MQTLTFPSARLVPRLFQPPPGRCVLTEVAGLLSLPPAQAVLLGASQLFALPQMRLAWWLQFESTPPHGRPRPCVMLPVAPSALDMTDLPRVLRLQAQLQAEGSWMLGISPEGWLQLTSLQWFDRAHELVQALREAQDTVDVVIRSLEVRQRLDRA